MQFVNSVALDLLPVSAAGYSGSANVPVTLTAPTFGSNSLFFVQTLSGDLHLHPNIVMSGAGGNITLVSAGIFDNLANAALVPGAGGRWLVYAATWIGENRGGLVPTSPQPNFYNCSFGGPCGVVLPGTGNHFIYRAQPTLTIAPGNLTREYGDVDPPLPSSASGLVNGDSLTDALGTLNLTTGTTQSSPVGTYPISGSFASPVGYAVNVQPGATLTITPAPLAITADNQSKVYGAADPLLTASFSGFKLGETGAIVSGLALTAPTGAAAIAGTHPIVTAAGTSPSAPNYLVSFVPGTLNVAQATLTYVANPVKRLVGTPNPPLSGGVSGFVYGDTLASATTGTLNFTTAAGLASPAGAYAVNGTGLAAANYTFVPAPGNATALTVVGGPRLPGTSGTLGGLVVLGPLPRSRPCAT